MAYKQAQKIRGEAAIDFGQAVAMRGYYSIVSDNSVNGYFYERGLEGTWSQSDSFTIPGATTSFGDALDIGNLYFIAGDPAHTGSTGRAGVFFIDDPSTLIQTFTGVAALDIFGDAVAISDDYILIGARGADSSRGDAYLYTKGTGATWTAYSGNPITPTLRTSNDFFGCAVAISGDTLIIGAEGDNNKTGAIYIFEKNDETELWEESQKLLASDGNANDQFGEVISTDGSYFVAGASLAESADGDINAGAAYVYKYGTSWYEVDKLVGIDESIYAGNHFGESVDINGDYIIIGSPEARSTGVADIFYKKRSWGHLKKVVGSDSLLDDSFGIAVGISGRFALVGASAESINGAVYYFEDPPVRLRLAQEFEVNEEYLPTKASTYLKRIGENTSDYWPIYNTAKTVIDATNFSIINQADTEPNVTINADQVKKIVASDLEASDYFGRSVSISGDYAIIGCDRKDVPPGNDDEGAAYIFYRDPDNPNNQWNQVKKIVASDPEVNAYFGTSVSISGDYAVVGADGKDESPGNDDEGAAYIFYRDPDNPSNQWSQVKKIVASDKETNARFGSSVSISGDYAIVGAYLKDESGFNHAGAAYIFYRDPDNPSNQWDQVKKITASDLEVSANFGVSVSISGDYAVVGANLKDEPPGNDDEGAAYIFYRDPDNPSNQWSQVKKIVASDLERQDNFGISVSISEDYIVVGANLEDGDLGAEGAAYIYYKYQGGGDNWGQIKKIVADERSDNDSFGWSVSISGDYIVVGAYQKSATLDDNSEGAAYIFYRDPYNYSNQWNEVKKIVASDLESNANFGWSVAISEDYVISGAYRKNEPPGDDGEGAAYVFYIGDPIYADNNIIMFEDIINNFTGNGYMIARDELYPASDFGVINYPIRAIESDIFTLWIRCISTELTTFQADILIDGVQFKTINEIVSNPSDVNWDWINTTIVLPDTKEHIMGIKIKENGGAIDKIYIDASDNIPYFEGPDYGESPYLTLHMQVYDSVDESPGSSLFIYDYKNSIDQVVQSDWYNFNINILDSNHGYTSASDFAGNYFLVVSSSGTTHGNFVVWEMEDNDEYMALPSAFRF